ncbi:hypothetical protein H6G20_26545 [Desertifilum sp. FACHB-1129]|uniref:MalT-like TPR region domain-containing protein n=1 Tax=Desertifilum tharense IPPAS B-1220 TaxID=1781255 RepID=A0A1E5QQR0_9CYAN|nr:MULTISPECIES: tetratricopeptide repeat protein [Desertifilum]MDA0212013.1 hypothetical protein [Cyanobacteria bacterium FC1]MBD2315228.1 hypothetical protein [Desertifilum sp. FACHB-1129]MBD2324929.1 hypothetical protein [Desertifilum sp. FACHB-866]MBD2335022.1 hypothetical protein [Desertifilum sp. FACHB-868]OEJ77015.1 hypothetical protein BH720_01455 [Desertifilum tharense IPPAS B-1220]
METTQATTLKDLAVQLALAGRSQEADATFAEALVATREIKGKSSRAIALCQLATALAQAHRYPDAEALLVEIPLMIHSLRPISSQENVRCAMALALAQIGQFPQAMEIARSLQQELPRLDAIKGVAKLLAQAGQFSQAADAIRLIPGYRQVPALGELGVQLIQADRCDEAAAIFAEARKVAAGLERWSIYGLVSLSKILTQVDRLQEVEAVLTEAKALVDLIGDEVIRENSLEKLALALSEVGRFEEAIAIARTLSYPSWPEKTLREVVAMMAKVGEFSQAKELADSIPINGYRGEALQKLGEAMSLAGHPQAEAVVAEAKTTLAIAWKAYYEAIADELD